MKQLLLKGSIILPLLLGIGGCSTTAVGGIYTHSPSMFGGESIRLNGDGTFAYSNTSDDLGENCEIFGTWELAVEKPTTVITRAKTLEPASHGEHCKNQPEVEMWTVSSRKLTRLVDGKHRVPFRKVASDYR